MGDRNTQTSINARVCGVVVTYYPDPDLLDALLDAITKQVEEVLIVDNTLHPDRMGPAKQYPGTYLRMGRNIGLSAAYNKGIGWARENGFAYVLLLDQDSIAEAGMVDALVRADVQLRNCGHRVAAVGPQFRDAKYLQPAPFIRLDKWLIRRIHCGGEAEYIASDYLISSGTLLRLESLDVIGEMDEALFIDYVDIEWGLRARSLGYSCFGVCAARMAHDLGDAIATIWLLKWREVPIHAPFRHYYLFRNAILLYRRRYIALGWKVNDFYRLILKFGFYAIVTAPRLHRLFMMTRGLLDGVKGVIGEYGRVSVQRTGGSSIRES